MFTYELLKKFTVNEPVDTFPRIIKMGISCPNEAAGHDQCRTLSIR